MKERYTCDSCGKIVPWGADSSTEYGCANPCEPEPYDPVFYCKKCANKKYKEFCDKLKWLEDKGIFDYHKPYWIMPLFVISAMKDCGWVMSEKAHHIKKSSPQTQDTLKTN